MVGLDFQTKPTQHIKQEKQIFKQEKWILTQEKWIFKQEKRIFIQEKRMIEQYTVSNDECDSHVCLLSSNFILAYKLNFR